MGDWEPVGGGCDAWAQATYDQCVIDCTIPPGIPDLVCVENCVLEAKEELEVAIRDYLLDQYMRSITLSDCLTEPTKSGRFSRASCRSYCYASNSEPMSIFDYKEVVCGTGCCLYTSDYCRFASGEVIIIRSGVQSLIVCDDSQAAADCLSMYGLSYHTTCKTYDCKIR